MVTSGAKGSIVSIRFYSVTGTCITLDSIQHSFSMLRTLMMKGYFIEI